MHDTTRRDFLRVSMASLAAAGWGSVAMANQQDSPAGVPTRLLGRTGERVSLIGLGGYHIGIPEEKEAIALMHEAIDEGVRFLDNSWDYHDGGSEEVMGKALAIGGRRDKVFLMTKVCARDYNGARQHLDDSLRRLRTDMIDLWQFHEVNWDVDPDWIFDRGGLRYALEAQKAGKIRYIGFTGHKDPQHQLKMLAKPFPWHTAQMPINVLDAHYRSFQHLVVPECTRLQVGVIGMKALSSGKLPSELQISAEVCRRFALSLPISTLVCGIASRKDLRQDLAIARNFRPMTPEELEAALAQSKTPGNDGKFEHYKTTRYGSDYHFKQHGE